MQKHTHKMMFTIVAAILLYWLYLAFITQPILVYDAKSYEDLGLMIHNKGWQEYFITGPNREPIYPFLVALSMQFAGTESYGNVLKCFQFGLLVIALFLFIKLLNRAGISKPIVMMAMMYFGFSPAIVNSAFSMFSEGVTYPFILGLIFIGALGWRSLQNVSAKMSFSLGLGFGVMFVLITMIKGIYEMIFPMVLIPFIIVGVRAWMMKNHRIVKNASVFLAATVFVFVGCVSGYKALNKKYNDLFVLTDRASWAFYGAAARRAMPLDVNRLGAVVTYALFEEQGCKVFYSTQECAAWHVRTSEALGAEKNYEVTAKFPRLEQNKQMFKEAFGEILKNPFQYIFLTGLEWMHMFYWETTQIGFVVYPDWLEAIFLFSPFADGLRFIVGTASFIAFFFGLVFLWKNRNDLWPSGTQSLMPILVMSVCIIFCHVSLYSLFAIVPRHAVPVAPVLILIAACVADGISRRRYRKSIKEML